MTHGIPYTVIGGYLGAGKTTLLNHLLRQSAGLRLAVLVNDFGDINIDADLIVSHDGETMQLANGCICCSLADGFMMALAQVSQRADRLDHVIVEASGVSNPVKISHYGAMLRLDLNGIIVLADAEQIRDKAANKYVGDTVIRQIRGADLIVLNKVDLVSADELADVRAWLRALAPDARLVDTTYGRVPLAILLGAHDETPPRDRLADTGHDHDLDAYDRAVARPQRPVSTSELETWYAALPEGVLRVKGWLRLTDAPTSLVLAQGVGRRLTLTPTPGDAEREPVLVLLGLSESLRDVTAPDGSPLTMTMMPLPH